MVRPSDVFGLGRKVWAEIGGRNVWAELGKVKWARPSWVWLGVEVFMGWVGCEGVVWAMI